MSTSEPGLLEAQPTEEETTGARRRRRRRPREVWGSLVSGALVGVIVSIGLVALLGIVIPAMGGGRALTVMTSSMQETLPPGTLVVTMPVRAAEIEVGDVLTYQLRSGQPTLVTHRVVQRLLLADGRTAFRTKGDSSPAPDLDLVEEVQVVGTVRYSIPYLGWATRMFTGVAGNWVVSALVAGLFLYSGVMIGLWVRDRRRVGSLRSERSGDSVAGG